MSEVGVALELRGVSKRYPGTLAVDGVDLTVLAGEVHAIVGENGAGKSTLMKTIAGSFNDYSGEILVNTKEVALHSPAIARSVGIGMIHQELSLAPPLSVAENLLAGRLPKRFGLLDRRRTISESRRLLEQIGLNLDPNVRVEEISQHEAQLVEIAKTLGNRPCILVMDEPTSSLSRDEVGRLFEIIRRLRNQGLAIIYISHHLSEVFEIADRVTVMRDGRKVAMKEIAEATPAQIVEMMIGGMVSDLYAERAAAPGEYRFRVTGLTRWGFFHEVSFSVRKGEIFGIGGLSGSGRSELARSLCGIDPVDAGTIELDGRRLKPSCYREAIEAGIAYLTEDRKQAGLALRMTMAENALSAVIPRLCRLGVYLPGRWRDRLTELISSLRVSPPDPGAETGSLSGGNQQKVLLAKWLAAGPEVLILDEPTRGVDVGAKGIIHRAIAKLADDGKSVILISSDLPELVGLSDRIAIMRKGRLIGEMAGTDCAEEAVLLAANGEVEMLKT
ncbi:MAG TPA: sugar ABC transporter ATP-binding protein [Candidatus Brocadiia bacterium]|nr:sugar ABC transporter ATP-binding protein [Candidatus Brocadiia bacterium]